MPCYSIACAPLINVIYKVIFSMTIGKLKLGDLAKDWSITNKNVIKKIIFN